MNTAPDQQRKDGSTTCGGCHGLWRSPQAMIVARIVPPRDLALCLSLGIAVHIFLLDIRPLVVELRSLSDPVVAFPLYRWGK